MASSGRMTAVNGGSGTVSTPANNVGSEPVNRRISSASQSGTLFSGLMTQKRSSQDAAAQARRQSFNEQKPQAGFIGNMWSKFTTGH